MSKWSRVFQIAALFFALIAAIGWIATVNSALIARDCELMGKFIHDGKVFECWREIR